MTGSVQIFIIKENFLCPVLVQTLFYTKLTTFMANLKKIRKNQFLTPFHAIDMESRVFWKANIRLIIKIWTDPVTFPYFAKFSQIITFS